MANLHSTTIERLNTLATIARKNGEGIPVNPATAFEIETLGPENIHEKLDRSSVNEEIKELADNGTIGEAMTRTDEVALLAALERDMQASYTSRTRRLAHSLSRATGQGMPTGIFLYGIQKIIARPEST